MAVLVSWTNIPKPTGTPYTKVSYRGGEFFDDAAVDFDDPDIFFDGIDESAWTMVSRESQYEFVSVGMLTGLIAPPVYSQFKRLKDPWVRVSKPN